MKQDETTQALYELSKLEKLLKKFGLAEAKLIDKIAQERAKAKAAKTQGGKAS